MSKDIFEEEPVPDIVQPKVPKNPPPLAGMAEAQRLGTDKYDKFMSELEDIFGKEPKPEEQDLNIDAIRSALSDERKKAKELQELQFRESLAPIHTRRGAISSARKYGAFPERSSLVASDAFTPKYSKQTGIPYTGKFTVTPYPTTQDDIADRTATANADRLRYRARKSGTLHTPYPSYHDKDDIKYISERGKEYFTSWMQGISPGGNQDVVAPQGDIGPSSGLGGSESRIFSKKLTPGHMAKILGAKIA